MPHPRQVRAGRTAHAPSRYWKFVFQPEVHHSTPFYFHGLVDYCEWNQDMQTGIITGYLQSKKEIMPPACRFHVVWIPSDLSFMSTNHRPAQYYFGSPVYPPTSDIDLNKMVEFFARQEVSSASVTDRQPLYIDE